MYKLGLGTWAFGGRAYGPMEDSISIKIVQEAYKNGIRFFDTANIYASGKSEELLGEGIKNFLDAQICTKIGHDISSGKPIKNYSNDFLETSLAMSLKRLQRNQIDLLLLHNPPTDILEKPDVYNWLNSKIKSGQILRWGVSVYDSIKDAELALDGGAHAIEARYSLIRRDIIDDLPMNKWKFDFIARSPLDGGLLSGKYTGHQVFPDTDQRSAKKFEIFKANNDFLEELRPLIDNGTVHSFTELAIRFVAFESKVTKVIPGAKSVEQLEQNIQAVIAGPLPSKAIDLINTHRTRFVSLVN